MEDKRIQKTESDMVQKDPKRLKHAWEQLMNYQKKFVRSMHKSKMVGQVSSVRIVKNDQGRDTVKIDMVGGGTLLDAGDKHSVFSRMIPKQEINVSVLHSLLHQVEEKGFQNVADGLSSEMRAALKKECIAHGISLTETKAEKRAEQKKLLDQSIKLQNQERKEWMADARVEQMLRTESIIRGGRTSGFTEMKKATVKLKAAEDERCKRVLREKYEIFLQEYYEAVRQKLPEINEKASTGQKLTAEDAAMLKSAELCGLKADKTQERPTSDQIERRKSLTIASLSLAAQNRWRRTQAYYEAIHETKKASYDQMYEVFKNKKLKGCDLEISPEAIKKAAYEAIRPKSEWEADGLIGCKTLFNNKTAEIRRENKDLSERIHDRLLSAMREAYGKETASGVALQKQKGVQSRLNTIVAEKSLETPMTFKPERQRRAWSIQLLKDRQLYRG